MKILQVHCRYSNAPGGEEIALEEERGLLQASGHTVDQYFADNKTLLGQSAVGRVTAAARSLWNPASFRDVASAIRASRPDVVHVHNTFAVLSPSVLWAAHACGVPCVLTLHNYRLLCGASILLRDGSPCVECVGRFPYAAVQHHCVSKESHALVLSIAASNWLHGLLGTFQSRVDGIIVMTEFQREMMVRGGLPADRIHVKPNSIADPGSSASGERRKQLLYIGMVSEAKGVDLLLAAWDRIDHRGYSLCIVGSGPSADELRSRHAEMKDLHWRGRLGREESLQEVAGSEWVVVPSRWYEVFPMVVVEALASGTPVIASDHGSLRSILSSGKDALLFSPGDQNALAAALERAMTMGAEYQGFSTAARQHYVSRYSPARSYEALMAVYEAALLRYPNARFSGAEIKLSSARPTHGRG